MRTLYFVLAAFLICSIPALSQVAIPAPGIITVPAWGIEGARPSMPILTTPIVSLTPVSSSPVGATNATAGLVAGATNSTLNNVPGPTSAVTMQPQFLTSQGAPIEAYEFESAGPEPRQPLKTGPAQFSSAYNTSATPGNLAEAARSYRLTRPGHQPRVYTNDDIQRIQQKPVTTPIPTPVAPGPH